MHPDLEALRITEPQLEKITGLDIGNIFMGGVIRPSALRSPQRLLSLMVTEGVVLLVIFIISMGVGLVILRNWSSPGGIVVLVPVATGVAIASAIGWHLYQWQRCKTLQSLARLLDEVDRHNDIIQAVQVMDELETVQVAGLGLLNRAEVILALQATRESLVSALMTEKILRRHRSLMQRRQELFKSIETSLATLQTLSVNNQAAEYQQFLQEALEIGVAVQQEMATRRERAK